MDTVNIAVGLVSLVAAFGLFGWIWTAKAEQIPHLKVQQWTGNALTLLGMAYLSANVGLEGAGFITLGVGSVVWLVYGLETKQTGLWTLQLGLIAFNVLGVVRWIG